MNPSNPGWPPPWRPRPPLTLPLARPRLPLEVLRELTKNSPPLFRPRIFTAEDREGEERQLAREAQEALAAGQWETVSGTTRQGSYTLQVTPATREQLCRTGLDQGAIRWFYQWAATVADDPDLLRRLPRLPDAPHLGWLTTALSKPDAAVALRVVFLLQEESRAVGVAWVGYWQQRYH